jgi:acetyltransferase-like isoleucine patch superfamily enzyme
MLGRLTSRAYSFSQRAGDKVASIAIGSACGAFGSHTALEFPAEFIGASAIFIGKHVWLGRGARLVASSSIGSIHIGEGCKSSGNLTIIASAPVTIGEKVLLATNVSIVTHACLDPNTHRPVRLNDGCWIGQNAVIHGGVEIGRGAVVGANTTVIVDVPDYCVAVGSPARTHEASRSTLA